MLTSSLSQACTRGRAVGVKSKEFFTRFYDIVSTFFGIDNR